MSIFEDYIYDKVKLTILSWNNEIIDDIYAISFYIEDECDDPRMPVLTLGYNTLSNWQEQADDAEDADEAKWNYAFWLQNQELVIGSNYHNTDEIEQQIRLCWIKDLGLYYSDEEENEDFDRAMEKGMAITHKFVKMAIRVAQKLHDNKVIKLKFNKPIPIIVHELEYYEEIAEQTKEANPPGVADAFACWVYNL